MKKRRTRTNVPPRRPARRAVRPPRQSGRVPPPWEKKARRRNNLLIMAIIGAILLVVTLTVAVWTGVIPIPFLVSSRPGGEPSPTFTPASGLAVATPTSRPTSRSTPRPTTPPRPASVQVPVDQVAAVGNWAFVVYYVNVQKLDDREGYSLVDVYLTAKNTSRNVVYACLSSGGPYVQTNQDDFANTNLRLGPNDFFVRLLDGKGYYHSMQGSNEETGWYPRLCEYQPFLPGDVRHARFGFQAPSVSLSKLEMIISSPLMGSGRVTFDLRRKNSFPEELKRDTVSVQSGVSYDNWRFSDFTLAGVSENGFTLRLSAANTGGVDMLFPWAEQRDNEWRFFILDERGYLATGPAYASHTIASTRHYANWMDRVVVPPGLTKEIEIVFIRPPAMNAGDLQLVFFIDEPGSYRVIDLD